VVGGEAERTLALVAARPAAGARAGVDTLRVRFLGGAQRVRNILRRSGADLLWPLPAGFLDAGIPAGWRMESAPARPERRLLLILRPDVPPVGSSNPRIARPRHGRGRCGALGIAEPLRRLVSGTQQTYSGPGRARRTKFPPRARGAGGI
jgi:hypothetical protein